MKYRCNRTGDGFTNGQVIDSARYAQLDWETKQRFVPVKEEADYSSPPSATTDTITWSIPDTSGTDWSSSSGSSGSDSSSSDFGGFSGGDTGGGGSSGDW